MAELPALDSEVRQLVDRRKPGVDRVNINRSEEHTSELQSLMRNSYAGFCLKKNKSVRRPRTNTTVAEHKARVTNKTSSRKWRSETNTAVHHSIRSPSQNVLCI